MKCFSLVLPDLRSLTTLQVAFLIKNNMSFDMWSKEGVNFQREAKAKETLSRYAEKEVERREKERQPTESPTIEAVSRRRVELRRREDIDFHARAMANLREWLDSPSGVNPYDMPPCNSFLRRSLYESIQTEYPTLILENAGEDNPNVVRVWRLSDREKKERERRLQREEWEKTIEKVGMWRIFSALSRVCRGLPIPRNSVLFADSYNHVDWSIVEESGFDAEESLIGKTGKRIPVVVHHGFMDLCFLMTHFVEPDLPDDLWDCKVLLREYFPLIYDTKVMSTDLSLLNNQAASNLAALYRKVVLGEESGFLSERVEVVEAQNDDNTSSTDQEHEAAYDAFMTGTVFIALCETIFGSLLQRSGFTSQIMSVLTDLDPSVARISFCRNLLYQPSMYTMDLEENRDPLSRGLLLDTTYRVSGFDAAVSTRDIVAALSNLKDSRDRDVAFDIIWIDDTTFLVTACATQWREGSDPNDSVPVPEEERHQTLRESGSLLKRALDERFTTATIVSLSHHLSSCELGPPVKPAGIFERLLTFFGVHSDKRSREETPAMGSNKRQRIA